MAGSDAAVVDRFPAAPDAPSIPGLVIRHLRRPADYPRLNEIANAMRQRIGRSFTTTDEQMAAFYDGADRFDADRDVAVFELDAEIVGYPGRV